MANLEERVGELERGTSLNSSTLADHTALLLQIKRDIATSFGQVALAQEQDRQEVAAQFDQAEKNRAAMETRILDAFNQLIAMVDARLPPPKVDSK